ncbi:MAG: alpha-glucan family phosphorylase, partial [Candidatus Hydrogenedentes bacterium]|nr:alpha-glucan family phosphorylase [Candidatus Hydrogenedentota bacterium]
LHGEVARNMWSHTWRDIPENEIPIFSVTNGIHIRSFISRDLSDLYDRYLGPGWINRPDDQSIWERVDDIPDTEIWRTHERRRERLVDFARRRLYQQYNNRGMGSAELRSCLEVLDPGTLTIGFARRFATYKRATLILQNIERFRKILLDPDRPVQFIVAGKAHPQDTAGKQYIRDLYHFARDPKMRNNFIFVEDYDINVARYIVQRVDCWLNTPRRPMEASGTSGMKAAANGALNISIPDGWWCEAEGLGVNGWSIGKGERYDTTEEQDKVESEALYEILEREVVPIFYDRGRDDLPRHWIERMKTSIRTICPIFNTYRMVQEYAERFYIPCSKRRNDLMQTKRARALTLAGWKSRVRQAWPQVHFKKVQSGGTEGLPVGSKLPVTAEVFLGPLTNSDVTVEVYYGDLDPQGQIPFGRAMELDFQDKSTDSVFTFEGAIPCDRTGELGFTFRVIPNHPDLAEKHELALIAWA